MEQQIEASIEIEAPIEAVWETVHDSSTLVEGIDWVYEAWWEADLEIILEPVADDRTSYTQRMQFRALPVFRPLGWLLERTAMKRKMQRDFVQMILPNYKRIAEGRAVS